MDQKDRVFTPTFIANLFLIAGTVSSGDSFFTNFGADARDTGMDFFNSLAEAASGEPYTQFKTLYPPLANLLFFLLGKSVPEDVSSKWASTHGAVVAMRGTAMICARIRHRWFYFFSLF